MTSIGKSVGWLTLAQIIVQLSGLLGSFALARILPPQVFGAVAIALFAALIARRLLIDGVSSLIVSEKTVDRQWLGAANIIAVLVSCIACISMLSLPVFAPGSWGGDFRLASTLLSVLPLLDGAGAVALGVVQKREEYRGLAVRSLLATMLSLVAAVAAALAGLGVYALIIQQIVQAATSSLLLLSIAPDAWQFRTDAASMRRAIRGFFTLATNSITLVVAGRLDILLVGTFWGPAAAGIFSFAKRLVETVRDATSSGLSTVAMAASGSIDGQDRRSGLLVAFDVAMLLLMPISFGIAAISPELISLTVGPMWKEAAPLLAVLVLSIPAQFVTIVLNASAIGVGRRKDSAKYNLVACALLLATLPMAVFSTRAAACAYLTCSVLSGVAAVFIFNDVLAAPSRALRSAIAPLLASLAMAASIGLFRWLDLPEAQILALKVISGVAVYTGAICVLSPDSVKLVTSIFRARFRSVT